MNLKLFDFTELKVKSKGMQNKFKWIFRNPIEYNIKIFRNQNIIQFCEFKVTQHNLSKLKRIQSEF